MATGVFAIGPNKWTRVMGGCALKYASAGEFKSVKADGKNDSRQTWLGRHNATITIGLKWVDDSPPDATTKGSIDGLVCDFLETINPRGPNGGKAWQWTEGDQRIHAVYNVTVEKVESERPPGSGEGKATITLFSWVKPVATPSVTKTPKAAGPWSPGPSKPQPAGAPKKSFTQSPPKVDP